jgi:hypothetical protein
VVILVLPWLPSHMISWAVGGLIMGAAVLGRAA